MIKASYYRTLITPRSLTDRELRDRITGVVGRGEAGKATQFTVRIPHVDVERARELLVEHEYQILEVVAASSEELAEVAAVAERIGGYQAEDFVEDQIVFKIPDVKRRGRN